MITQAAARSVPGARRRFEAGNVLALARKEVRDALRNRWFVFYAVAFAVLAISLAFLSLAGTETFGYTGYGRTAASLINLVILLVPLMALTAGAGAISPDRERGSLAYLLAQPVSRLEVLAGKYVGLALALLAALAIGFGASCLLIAPRQQIAGAELAWLVVWSAALALSMLSVGVLLSVCCRRAATALGAAVVLWLGLVLLGDLGLMGSALVMDLSVERLFTLALLSPLQVFKMAALESVRASLDVLGPAGLYAQLTHGDSLPALFAGVMAVWILLPLAVAALIFVRRSEP
jgi:Cu-processing system permease protein